MELKDLLEKLDISVAEDATDEQIEQAVREKYIAKELVAEDEELAGKVFGKRAGELETLLKRNLKALGVEDEKLKDFNLKKFKENEDEYFQAIAKRHEETVKELKEAAGKGNDKKVEDLSKKLEEYETKNKSLAEMLQEKETILQEKEQNFNTELKNFKLNQRLNDVKSKFTLSDTVDEYRKKGFEVSFNEKYKVDLNEADELVIFDKDGNPVKNEKQSGFDNFENVYKRELIAANMLKVNNGKTDTPPATERHEQPSGTYLASAGKAQALREAANRH